LDFTSLLTTSIKTKNSNKYVVAKFNANIKLKLSLRWKIKYMVIKNLDNNRLGKLKTPSHSSSQIPTIPSLI
jgi:hypothetical protein